MNATPPALTRTSDSGASLSSIDSWESLDSQSDLVALTIHATAGMPILNGDLTGAAIWADMRLPAMASESLGLSRVFFTNDWAGFFQTEIPLGTDDRSVAANHYPHSPTTAPFDRFVGSNFDHTELAQEQCGICLETLAEIAQSSLQGANQHVPPRQVVAVTYPQGCYAFFDYHQLLTWGRMEQPDRRDRALQRCGLILDPRTKSVWLDVTAQGVSTSDLPRGLQNAVVLRVQRVDLRAFEPDHYRASEQTQNFATNAPLTDGAIAPRLVSTKKLKME